MRELRQHCWPGLWELTLSLGSLALREVGRQGEGAWVQAAHRERVSPATPNTQSQSSVRTSSKNHLWILTRLCSVKWKFCWAKDLANTYGESRILSLNPEFFPASTIMSFVICEDLAGANAYLHLYPSYLLILTTTHEIGSTYRLSGCPIVQIKISGQELIQDHS